MNMMALNLPASAIGIKCSCNFRVLSGLKHKKLEGKYAVFN